VRPVRFAVVFRASCPTSGLSGRRSVTIVGEVEKTNIDRTALILVGEVLAARGFPRQRAL